jgi:hypothetical protein
MTPRQREILGLIQMGQVKGVEKYSGPRFYALSTINVTREVNALVKLGVVVVEPFGKSASGNPRFCGMYHRVSPVQ